jgi:putative intracellular protease/amidase
MCIRRFLWRRRSLFRDGLAGLGDPIRIADVIASGLDQYDAIFVPVGHGPMIDLLDTGVVMRHFHKVSKPTAVLCQARFITPGSSKFN